MSMIDKILSGLKKRGTNALPAEPAVREAHAPKNRVKAILTGVAGVGLVCAAAWLLWGARQKIPARGAQAPAKPISAPQTVSPPVAAPSVASGVVMSQPIAPSQPIAIAAQEVSPKEAEPKESTPKEIAPKETAPKEKEGAPKAKEGGQEIGAAAVGAEQELNVPPPPEVRAKPLSAAGKKKRSKVASLSPSNAASAVPDEGAVPATEGSVDKQIKPLSPQQQADNEFRRANGLMQQGRASEALAGYEAALQLDPGHDAARQAMVVLLLENRRNADAERVLQDGLKHNIKNSSFAMLLARLQIERDASWSALLTLQKTLPYAERQADYRAFVAALLQRLNRHKEAVAHYQAAVQLSPDTGVWWMGLGISLRALQRNEEARAAFQRALETHTLNADLQAFVAQQLREL